MAIYNTPGVYVEEIPTLAPSVAQVATAIPVFIGYTQQGPKLTPTRIDTLLDYESLFGKANPSAFTVATTTDANTKISSINTVTRTDSGTNKFLMHYGLSLYFRNGGGSCYIVSVGNYSGQPSKTDLEAGLTLLEKEDEPTLIVLLDAVSLPTTDYYDLCVKALAQCRKLGDRFLIADIPDGNTDTFRSKIVGNDLCYGAAYHPYLQSTLTYQYVEDNISVTDSGAVAPTLYQWSSDDKGLTVSYSGDSTTPTVSIVLDTADQPITGKAVFNTDTVATLVITISSKTAPSGADVAGAWSTWKTANPGATGGFDIQKNGAGTAKLAATDPTVLTAKSGGAAASQSLASLRTTNTSLYNQIKTALNDQRVQLPPSPAIAGIYASVDRDRGVWKAPANVAVKSIIGPTAKISDAEQDRLNIDATAGKSINAIRDFTGKGTLVWGARTLAGNDNEWRYVSVRRLFITIEESTRKATAFAVFEPNDATTWLKVKAMIESYLYGLWQQGALGGSKPESAYFVNVGLGKTMTSQDILEGRMIVEIGVAAVRPAEFIVLRFSHKMQEA